MSFSLEQFYRINRRASIWVILFALLWLLHDFFALIFLTFVLAFVASPLADVLQRKARLKDWIALPLVYLLLLVALGGFVSHVTPAVIWEANTTILGVDRLRDRALELKADLATQYPVTRRMISGYMRAMLDEDRLHQLEDELARTRAELELGDEDVSLESSLQIRPAPDLAPRIQAYFEREDRLLVDYVVAKEIRRLQDAAPHMIAFLYKASATFLLALLFSFLILIDRVRLQRVISSLEQSRLRDFVVEAGQPVVRFGYVVGRAIQAQAIIACINTALTAVGVVLLGIPSLALLSVIVFVCSFIPVLGVFISTTPIVLIALNAGGFQLGLAAIGMVIIIHLIEAYLLNPLIYGRHLNLNPVLVLIILLVTYHAFGIWGMLLGVPVTQYLMHDVFGVPVWHQSRLGPGAGMEQAAVAPAPAAESK